VTAAIDDAAPSPRTIYLVRHAIAEERGPKWPDDDQRPLTRQGIARMRLAVRGLRRLGVQVDHVLTSPLVRAAQTAEILSRDLKSAPKVTIFPPMAPGNPPAAVAAALAPFASARALALVGHEPDLGGLAAWLTGAREALEFRKGGVARIDVAAIPPGRTGRLVWFALPKMLRALA
jgi:phosphohistidine phosphatase